MYVGFGAVLVLLLALVSFANLSLSRLERANDWNVHSYRVLDEVQQLIGAVVDVQNGYRGYMLTGEEAFLEPLRAGDPAARLHLRHLLWLTADDPEQQRRIQEAERLAEEWIGQFVEPRIALRDQMDEGQVTLQELEYTIDARAGKEYSDAIRSLLEEVRAGEQRLLGQRARETDRLRAVTSATFLLGALFAILITVVLASLAVRRSTGLMGANERLEREAAERARAEQEVRRLSRRSELILSTAADGIWGLDMEGRTTFANPAVETLTGYTPSEMIGRTSHRMVHHTRADGTPYPESECPIWAVSRTGRPVSVRNEVFWRRDGSSFPVEYVASPITEDGKVIGTVVVFRDVTERREVERMKDEFVSVVSHELRTPLTSIRGSLGLLSSGMLGTLPERGQRLLEIATDNTDRLVRLVNDILDIERIESGQVEMERVVCDVDGLVDQSILVVQELATRFEIQLTSTPIGARVWADPDRIVQVLTNLLSNAIKFSEAGSSVEVRGEARDGQAMISVVDHGRGIPPELHEQVFGRFQQVDASDSRQKGGTGLGLAIVRSIVNQHGGRIWVDSQPGEGSTFTFTLPLVSDEESVPHGSPEPGREGLPLVLLCDDDESIRSVVGEQLQERGYRVATAADGEEALRKAAERRPGVILLDLIMPGLDGWETLARLKADPATRSIPVIIFSARSPEPREGVDAVEWVTKASADATLFGALDRALDAATGPGIARILIVEDDPDLASILRGILERDGVEALHARSCEDAFEITRERMPDLLVLDLVQRDGSTMDAVDCLRRDPRLCAVPLVVFSSAALAEDQRAALGPDTTEVLLRGDLDPRHFHERLGALLEQLLSPRTRER